jgi:hypothetical protein
MVQYKGNETAFPDDDRFIVHYEEPGFETYVEVFPDLSTKTYYTVYDVKKTNKMLSELEAAAEEVAMDECIKKYYY